MNCSDIVRLMAEAGCNLKQIQHVTGLTPKLISELLNSNKN